ncbi:hypothetical protein TKK_0006602 [Trichogramma kaykai]|uniref:CREG-like beta-barrel domain-containing protein n=1 Tax=Trichogramma kaykai TaxID=54128 RepID=A0ABD2XCK6_9HYME
MKYTCAFPLVLLLLPSLAESRNVIDDRPGLQQRREPPHHGKSALMARYIVNEANWTSVATISTDPRLTSYPYVNIVSSSDGPLGNGGGVPYLFLTPLDSTSKDLSKDNRATLMMSLVQGDWCKVKGYDPMDPRCARVIISGRIKSIEEKDVDHESAKSAIFGRHQWLSHMPANHHFYFARMEIETIDVLAFFGGAARVTPEDYYRASEESLRAYRSLYR